MGLQWGKAAASLAMTLKALLQLLLFTNLTWAARS
jgi:hypothetical protein